MIRVLTLCAVTAIASVTVAIPPVLADTPASHCIQASAAPARSAGNKGWLTNICNAHVAVVYGFDTKFDGTPKRLPWCRYENDQGNEFAAGAYGHILEPGERVGVGGQFEDGVRFGVHWAACEIDTSANNSVFFLIESPFFDFDATCGFDCL